MKAIWNWLKTPTAFRLVSFIYFAFLCFPVLVDKRSWWDTFNAAILFFGIWGLGYYSAPPAAQPAPVPLTEDELSNGLALALHDAVLIRIGKDDEATRQAIARIDKLVAKYKNEAAHGIGENNG